MEDLLSAIQANKRPHRDPSSWTHRNSCCTSHWCCDTAWSRSFYNVLPLLLYNVGQWAIQPFSIKEWSLDVVNRVHLNPLNCMSTIICLQLLISGCCVNSVDLLIMLWAASQGVVPICIPEVSHLSHISIISKYNTDIQSLDSKTVWTPQNTKSHGIWIHNAWRQLCCIDVHNYTTQDFLWGVALSEFNLWDLSKLPLCILWVMEGYVCSV